MGQANKREISTESTIIMSLMRNISIRHKLTAIIMLTCAVILLLAITVFIVWAQINSRHNLIRDLSAHAAMIGDNCKAALAFEDAKQAKETLSALHVQESIVFGCIHTPNGDVFASYYRDKNGTTTERVDREVDISKIPKDSHIFAGGLLTVSKGIVLDGEIIGTVYLQDDMRRLHSALVWDIVVAVVILVSVLTIAYVLTANVQKLVSGPILSLTESAARIGKGELNHRVKIHSNDELGKLGESFNDMAQKLKESYTHLEEKVRRRTVELSSANEKLETEIVQREQAQKMLEERIKEINCLYSLSRLVEQPQITFEQILEKMPDLIRNAYRHAETTCIRITFDGIHYQTDNFEKSELSQYAPIKVHKNKAGAIEAYYIGEKGKNGREPFIEEEQNLLDLVAERLSGIAEHKKAEDKLAIFRNLIKQSNDCIFVIDPEWGRILDVNDRTCESLGHTREELLKTTIKDIDESLTDDSSWQQLTLKLKLKGEIIQEGLYKRRDGTTFFVETSLKLVSQKNESYIIGVARDTTERKQAEERQAGLIEQVESINRELRDFAYIVSHDLKAPLRGIKSLTQWLSADYADKLDEKGQEQIKLLLSRAERMHNLIEGVLEYSRVGREKENRIQVNLTELLPEVIDMVAPPESIAITVENELPTVECEPTRIRQVFQNLLSNAVKYMDKPQGLITIGCVEDGAFWRFSVADNGPGIEEKHFERIFQMFQTLTSRDKFESTGVGLTVIKKIVEMYGGKIWVESQVSKGSTFFFTMPKQEMGVNKNAKLKADIVS